MEEILASIRRIISEDSDPDAQPAVQSAVHADEEKPEPPGPAGMDDDVLELTQMVRDDGSVVSVSEPESDPRPAEESGPELSAEEPEAEQKMSEDVEQEILSSAKTDGPADDDDALMSGATAAAATAAFAQLAGSLERDATPTGAGALPLGSGGRTLEDLVKEMLRPMLREWIDQNLPQIVERQVRKQIEKLVRQAEID